MNDELREEEWRPVYDAIYIPTKKTLRIPVTNTAEHFVVLDIQQIAAETWARMKAFRMRGIMPTCTLSPIALRAEFADDMKHLLDKQNDNAGSGT